MIVFLFFCIVFHGVLHFYKRESPYLQSWWLFVFGPTFLTAVMRLERIPSVSDKVVVIVSLVNVSFLSAEGYKFVKGYVRLLPPKV